MEWILIAAGCAGAYFYFASRKTARQAPAATDEGQTNSPSSQAASTVRAAARPANDETPRATSGRPAPVPRPLSARLALRCGDGAVHEVEVRECDIADHGGLLTGYCHSHRALHAIELRDIVEAVDLDTGATLSDLPAFAANRNRQSPIAAVEADFGAAADVIRALLHVARADEPRLGRAECMLPAFRLAAGNAALTMEQVERAWRILPSPSQPCFERICAALAGRAAADKLAILGAIEVLSATGRTLPPQRQQALDQLRAALWSGAPQRLVA